MTFSKQLNKQRGVSLFDLTLWLVAAALIFSLIYWLLSVVLDRYRTQQEMTMLGDLRNNISSLYANDVKYTGLNNELAIKAKLVKQGTFDASSNEILNAWKEQIVVDTANEGRHFTITTNGIPEAQCPTIASRFLSGAIAININGNANATTAAGIAAFCSEKSNTLKFTFN